jgi:hypothetical protein
MKKIWSTAVVVVAVSAAVAAQSGKDMAGPGMGDKMNMTYTGCVEAVNHGAWFLLTHVTDGPEPMMHHDGMMKSDSEMSKKEEPRASNEMHGGHMTPSGVVLTGRSDLQKHVGQKVTVSGAVSHVVSDSMPRDRDTLTVASLKVVAKSCR